MLMLNIIYISLCFLFLREKKKAETMWAKSVKKWRASGEPAVVQSPVGFVVDYLVTKFPLRQNLKKKSFPTLSRIREDKRYFVKLEIYAPGSVLIKAWNRNHESCPFFVLERTGVERFHSNLKKRQ